MDKKIAPSMMCCDFMKLSETLDVFKRKNIELLHIDVMDGQFVPNIQLGTDLCKQIKRNTDIPLDYHFMVEEPERVINYFDFIGENDYVSIHYESTRHVQRVLQAVKSKGAKPMLALNPATPICCMENVIDDIQGVLIMSVNPGFAGQKLIPQALKKISETRKFLDEHGGKNVEIEVDGNVSFENARLMSEAGANIFVAGTSSVFKGNMEENVDTLRKAIKI